MESANILGVFPYPSFSHQVVFQSLWRELSLRGHKVTVLTTNPLNDPSLTNLTEISMEEINEFITRVKLQYMESKYTNIFYALTKGFRVMDIIVEAGLNNTKFQKFIRDQNKTFDLILTECFFFVFYMMSERYGAPIVTTSSTTALTSHFSLMGSPNHPVLYPDLFLNSPDAEPSFWEKIKSVLFDMWSLFHHFYYLVPRAHKMAQKYLGENIPHLENVEKNVSMMYLNENLFLHHLRSHVPAIIQMGQIHLKPARPLPKDLQQVLDEAEEGVVYFSLGSSVKSISITKELREILIHTFSELPYKVIWKWESDFLPNKPPNVIINKWLPQQDLLGHPNVRIFITQGGVQSTEEAIDRGVPMVGLPFVHDQLSNMQRMAALGIGVTLDHATVTKDELKNAIVDVAENSFYKKQIKKVRNLLLDKYMNGLENAVWWSEYVIRHRGAKHLRSPSADISWFSYFMLDVFCIFLSSIIIIYWSCKMLMIRKTKVV